MTANTRLDLDRLVDYKAEYSSVIENPKISGDSLLGLCPFHRESNPSFSVNLKTGQWNCFTEGEYGNFISFWAKLHGVSNKDAYKAILDKYGYGLGRQNADVSKQQKTPNPLAPYSLEQYSMDKKLPIDFLREVCKADTGTDQSSGAPYLKLTYVSYRQDTIFRKRYGNKVFKWGYGARGRIPLYGEWRIKEFRRAGRVVLVEGESDAHTLWYMDIPAIGVPGAAMFKPRQASLLQDLTVYIHQEPDIGGETFVKKVCRGLKEGGFVGEVYRFSCRQSGTKDPSDLYIKHGKVDAARLIRQALQAAEPINIHDEQIPEAIPGAPINLRQPDGWVYDENGVSVIHELQGRAINICRTPVILTRRLRSIDTGEEKIEIAFKRDGRWYTAIYPRSVIFSSRGITVLSDFGCTITSENAKQMVRFLGALEAENIDVIPKADATSAFGWKPGNRFIPGHADGIAMDVDPSQRMTADAYCKSGSLENWIAHMTPHRRRGRFRFILAASFAAPLMRILKQRIFFVHNWGDSGGGKTAALKAALSAWGDPDRLMVNFNATQAALERMAALFCDLPLGIDERQLAGDNRDILDKIVYMIASGIGRLRAAKTGGLQKLSQWRTVALSTGEEPFSTDVSKTGVSIRTLEIYGAPFDNDADAKRIHQLSAADFGWAGPAFIEKVIAIPERWIRDAYEAMQLYLQEISSIKNGSHISCVAAVALSDAMIDSWLFAGARLQDTLPATVSPKTGQDDACPVFLRELGISTDSWQNAKRMAADILIQQVETDASDVNDNAAQFIVDWILSNKAYFDPGCLGTCLGMMSQRGDVAYIFPSVLSQALTKAGYSPRKTLQFLAERGLISSCADNGGKNRYSTTKWFEGRNHRFVEFFIGKIAGDYDWAENRKERLPGEEPCQQTDFYAQIAESYDENGDFPF